MVFLLVQKNWYEFMIRWSFPWCNKIDMSWWSEGLLVRQIDKNWLLDLLSVGAIKLKGVDS